MTIENILATFIALVCLLGACLVIAVPVIFIIYETRRFCAFLRRAFMRRRPAHAMPMMIKEASR